MIEMVTGILIECWKILLEASPYVLFGFFAAGLLKALVPEHLIAAHLGKNSAAAVLKAALFGVPLPLCSCGVIPAAIGLRQQGASKGASASFLVSVPETGVDSIAITYALLGPLLAVVRPLAALVTATLTGLFINLLPDDSAAKPETKRGACCGNSASHGHAHAKVPLLKRLRQGQAYAFGDLLGDIGKWLLFGILIAGAISFLVPEALVTRYLGSEFGSLLLMLVIGIPLYICASASTPIAAALILKGLSPGAALVFLLAGPATNAATLTLVTRYFGKAATAIYLTVIACGALLFGFLLNRFLNLAGIDLALGVKLGEVEASAPFAVASAVLLLVLIARSLLPGSGAPAECGCNDSSCSPKH